MGNNSSGSVERDIVTNLKLVYKKNTALQKYKNDIKQSKIDSLIGPDKEAAQKQLKLQKALEFSKRKVQRLNIAMKQEKLATIEADKAFDKASKSLGKFGKFAQHGTKQLVKFNGTALSMMFFGMAINRVFKKAMSSIFDGYKKAIPASSEFNRQTLALSANWEFFKFQLADAFAKSDLFQKFIGFAINLLHTFEKLPVPVKAFLVDMVALAIVLGTLAVVFGTMSLGIGAIINSFTTISAEGVITYGILGKISTTLWAIASYDLANITTGVETLGAKALGLYKSFSFAKLMTGLLNLGKGLITTAKIFAGTLGGAITIFGLSFLLAMKISEMGIKSLGLKYTSTLNTMKGTALDAFVGIAGIFGIIIPGAIRAVLKWALDAMWKGGKGLADALIAGLTGKSMSKAFEKQWQSFDMKSILNNEIMKPLNTLGQSAITIKKKLGWVKPIKDATDQMQKLNNLQDDFINQMDYYNAKNKYSGMEVNPITNQPILQSTIPSNSNSSRVTNIIPTVIQVNTPEEVLNYVTPQARTQVDLIMHQVAGSGGTGQ